jgi:hypothetical protein
MMIGYDIYDCFTMEHFRLRQRMTLTTKIYCSRLYVTSKLQFSPNFTLDSVADSNYRAKCDVGGFF